MDSPAHHGVTPIQSGPDRITHWAEDTDQGDAIKPGSEQKPEGWRCKDQQEIFNYCNYDR